MIQGARNSHKGRTEPPGSDHLGFTHACGKTRKSGRFKLTRLTDSKRMRAKLLAVKREMWKRMHLPIPEQGRWLARVLSGQYNYYAVPDNIEALSAFREQIIRHWLKSLRRRSQKHRMDWKRMQRSLINGYLCRAFCIPGLSSDSPPSPKAGAQCGNSARWDLRGGRPATAVPTATAWMVSWG